MIMNHSDLFFNLNKKRTKIKVTIYDPFLLILVYIRQRLIVSNKVKKKAITKSNKISLILD